MAYEPVDHPQFENVGGELRYTYRIRLRNSGGRLLPVVVPALAAVVIGGAILAQFVADDPAGTNSPIVWLIAGVLGLSVVSTLSMLLRALFGQETLTLGASRLTHALQLGPWKREKHYMASAIGELRWRDGTIVDSSTSRQRSAPSMITANYGSYTLEFMKGVSEAEAEVVIKRFDEALVPLRATA